MENYCKVCPRSCKVDRSKGVGFCQEGEKIRIAKIVEHFMWEEPCLADEKGTLAIFFSGCNLRCDYCQNHAISRGQVGREFTIDEFCKLIEEKQSSHSSIDLITPTHFSDTLCQAFKKIKKRVPAIWNTNGYETPENIDRISSFVDIFLTDLKYADDEIGSTFSKCQNYFSMSMPAIKRMCENKPDVMCDGILEQGVIIRHLVLPGLVKNSIKVLNEISQNFPNRIVSIMSQFTPNGKSSLNRKITAIEYKTVLSHMEKLGLSRGFVQDFESANECFIPDFE